MEEQVDVEDEVECVDAKRRRVEETVGHDEYDAENGEVGSRMSDRRHKVEELPSEVASLVVDSVIGGRHKWRFGIVSNGTGSDWKRCMEASSELVWIYKPIGHPLVDDEKEENAKIRSCMDLRILLHDEPVDVVLFEGKGPNMSHPIWKCCSLKLVAWSVGNSKCCAPLDSGWLVNSHSVRHSELGGSLTVNCRFRVATATPSVGPQRPRFRLDDPVSTGPGALECMIKLTESGRQCPPPSDEIDETKLGGTASDAAGLMERSVIHDLVDPKDRDTKFVVPCVFSKSGWVRRRLTAKEWLRGFDCPEATLKELSQNLLDKKAVSIDLPFKGRFHLIRSIGRYLDEIAALDPKGNQPPSKRTRSGDNDDEATTVSRKRLKPSSESEDEDGVKDTQLAFAPDYRTEELATLQWLRTTTIPPEYDCPLGPSPLPVTLRNQLIEISNHQISSFVPAEWRPKDESPPELLHPFIYAHEDDDPEEERNLKATKSDDATIPVHLWDDRVRNALNLSVADVSRGRLRIALDVLRSRLLRRWKRRVAQGFWFWWRRHRIECAVSGKPLNVDVLAPSLLAIHHAVDADWWDWCRGSAIFWWRFPIEWQKVAMLGLPPMFTGPPPRWRVPQRAPPNEETRLMERKKISKVRERGYVAPMPGISSLLSFFSVPKGDSDIRMVYDGTKSGLNLVLFAPWFNLPTVDTMLRSVDVGYYSADNDYGEMFLNFWLHADLRRCCGVDLSRIFPEELTDNSRTLWNAWTRNAMGLSPSPYASCQMSTRLKRLMLGDPTDRTNVYRWDHVVLNLPGNEDYDASMPWVYKARADGTIAADLHKYVDDVRVTAPTLPEVDQASSVVAKRAAYHGAQDAARKRRKSSQRPGAWAGSNIETESDAVYKTVSLERWQKTKAHIEQLVDWIDSDEIPRKPLESIRGYLVYVSLTYRSMVPYLKGVHLTLESWRPDRDEDGWRDASFSKLPADKFGRTEDPRAPKAVKQARRYADDVMALKVLTESDTPVRLRARPARGSLAIFIYGDASKRGFGTSIWTQGSGDVKIEEGLWNLRFREKSSNWREMCNLALALERLLISGQVEEGSEIFLFTDNSVTESAFYRGTSSSKELNDLVLRMRALEMRYSLFLRIVWVAGKRMIAQGTDGFSRGDLENGVATGAPMLSFVPLNIAPFSSSSNLEGWIRSTLPSPEKWTTLDPNGWFSQAHSSGHFIWNVPAAAASAAIEQLCEAKLARPEVSHIFLVPSLLTQMWRKKLGKIADVIFNVKSGVCVWPLSCHEPLTIALVCPLLSSSPWTVKRCGLSQRRISEMLQQVWGDDGDAYRDCLRELWVQAWRRADL